MTEQNTYQASDIILLPRELMPELELALVECDEFQTQSYLRALFAVNDLSAFQATLPTADSPRSRVTQTVSYLRRERAASGQPALIALLEILADRYSPTTARHLNLKSLINRLRKNLVGSSQTISPFIEKVKELFETCGYKVMLPTTGTTEYDLEARQTQGLKRRSTYIKCVHGPVRAEDMLALKSLREQHQYNTDIFYITSQQATIDEIKELLALGVECSTYDSLVGRMINFEPYVDAVMADLELQELQREYEQPYIETSEGKELAWPYIDTWLKDNTSNWLTVLGDYGVGKSALLKMLLLRLMTKYQQNPEQNPIPILIPLQRFTKRFDFRNLILDLFEDIELKGVYYDAFQAWVSEGRIILLLDSFDEMAQKLTRYEIHNNLRELIRGITGSSKAILTSRPTYFESNAERLRLFHGIDKISVKHKDYQIYQQYSEYDQFLQEKLRGTKTCQLADLDDRQRRQFFHRALGGNPKLLQQLEQLIDSVGGLDEMAGRPVFARLLMTAMPGIRSYDINYLPQHLNEASLFDFIITALLRRDQETVGEYLTDNDRHLFLKELSYETSQKNKDYFVDNSVIHSIVQRIFKHRIESSDTPEHFADMYFIICRRAAGLSLEKPMLGAGPEYDNSISRVGFSHNALREYVYAEFVVDHLFREETARLLLTGSLSDGTLRFLRYMLIEESIKEKLINQLVRFDKNSVTMRDFYFRITWQIYPNESREQIVSLVNDPPNMSQLDLSDYNLSNRDFFQTDFSDTLFGGTNLRNTNLCEANFSGAVIENVALEGAILKAANFSSTEVRSIVVYDKRQHRMVTKTGYDAREWLFMQWANIGSTDNINTLKRSQKYQTVHRLLDRLHRRTSFISSFRDRWLIQGISPANRQFAKSFVQALWSHGYLRFIADSTHGGGDGKVADIVPDKRDCIQQLYDGICPDDLRYLFDDID